MTEPRIDAPEASLLGCLLRVRLCAAKNRVREAVNESAIRVFATVVLVVVIWLGLYVLFCLVFDQFKQTPLEATVAIPLVFNFFFVSILALLTFSNALIVYGSLFGRNESAFLLSLPLQPRDVVSLKYIEGLATSSWSLFLLGLPLMMAIARMTDRAAFYPIFIAFFIAFIPIPGALGLVMAWVAARFFPRRSVQSAVVLIAVVIGVGLLWGVRMLRVGDMPAEEWLRLFLARMSFVEGALLPNNWVARGIDAALHADWAVAGCYLGVTIANALFLSWLAVLLVSRFLGSAYDRSRASRNEARRSARTAAGGLAGLVFFYLPRPIRLIAAKDLRTFLRDPTQWGQLVILFGLMTLYLTNIPNLQFRMTGSGWYLLIPFLNLCAISLILATFTCRFVFPLVSLEGQKLWLVGLLPMPRSHILLAKFAFAMTVTLAVAVGSLWLAVVRLDLDFVWTTIHLAVVGSVCFGLCGFAVGIGARMPMFDQTNVARIANGFGGTTNLMASVALVTIVLTGVGWASLRARSLAINEIPDHWTLSLCLASVLVAIGAGTAALIMGSRHFEHIEV